MFINYKKKKKTVTERLLIKIWNEKVVIKDLLIMLWDESIRYNKIWMLQKRYFRDLIESDTDSKCSECLIYKYFLTILILYYKC